MDRNGIAVRSVLVLMTVVASVVICAGNDKNTIGLQKVDGKDILLDNITGFVSKRNEPLNLWCERDSKWDVCYWHWNIIGDTQKVCQILSNGSHIGEPGCSVPRSGTRCQFNSTQTTEEHEGKWICELQLLTEVNPSRAETKLTILTPVGQVVTNPKELLIEVNHNASIEIKTGAGFPAARLELSLDGTQVRLPDIKECDNSTEPELCTTSRSFLYQAPPTPKESKLKCLAIQTDTYGRTQETFATVDISVVLPGVLTAGAWTSGQIAGLVVGLVFLLLILILLLLCYCCGWCCCAGCRKRRNGDRRNDVDRSTLVVTDFPTAPYKKEVSFIEAPLSNDTKQTLPNDPVHYANYEDLDDGYYQTQIGNTNDFWSNGYENTSRQMNSVPDVLPKPVVFRDKWDPYESESDVPFLFQFEGNMPQLTPATSLSSLASSHLDDIDLNLHLRHLDWINDNDRSSNYDSDSDTSADSDLLGPYGESMPQENGHDNPAFDDPDLFKSVDDESWV